jgi:TM2 domain-containing membrane protein YozV
MPDEDAIKFECPHCGQHIECSATMCGMEATCPACGKSVKVQPATLPLKAATSVQQSAPPYWLSIGNEKKGPYTFSQLKSMWGSGSITADALYCQEGFEAWVPISSLLDQKPPASLPQYSASAQEESEKRILPALILCLFIGIFGAHAVYAGRWKKGIAMVSCLVWPGFCFMLIGVCARFLGDLFINHILAFAAIACLPPLLVTIHVLCDLVWILIGSYKDGRGLKITKWT